jgi:D-alanyl-D-alanine dipeptidase
MLKYFFSAILFLFAVNALATHSLPSEPQALKHSKQLILVITKNWNAPTGTLQLLQRTNSNKKWQPINKQFHPVIVGKTGLAWNARYKKFNLTGPYKKEGDNKAPAGVFILKYFFGFNPQKNNNMRLTYIPLYNSTVCVCDPNSKYYNQIIDNKQVAQPDWRYEELMRSTKQYRYGIVINYNRDPAQPGAGSCIFMHIWDKPTSSGTAGCTAMSKANLHKILTWLDPAKHPVLVQLPQKQYELLKRKWNLSMDRFTKTTYHT